MGKSCSFLVAIGLSCLIWTLAVEAERSPIQVRYQDIASRIRPIDHVHIGQIRHAITDKKIYVPQGINDRVIVDWAVNLGRSQDIFNVSKECGRQLGEFAANLNAALSNLTSPLELFDEKNWSLKVIDSFGKLPSGVLVGGFGLLGDYSECVAVVNEDWQGKYCQINNGFLAQSTSSLIPFLFGICLPEACNNGDVKSIASSIINFLPEELINLVASNDTIVTCQEKIPFDFVAISASIIVSIFVFVALVATAYDIYKQHLCKKNKIDIDLGSGLKIEDEKSSTAESRVKFMQIVEIFSVYTNSKKLFDISSNSADQIDCLNAIRVITLGWVILCHCYSFMFSTLENKADLLKMSDRFSFDIVTNGFFSVDTFFLLSGFLTTHLFLKEMRKPNAKITPGFIFKYYFHRYWRLTPVYLMCIYMSVAFTPHTSAGPFHPGADGYEINRCRKSWWNNVLYINNLGIAKNEMCFGESWYLANDMQYYWLSPLILIPLSMKNKKYHLLGIILAIALVFQSFITIALILHANPDSAGGSLGKEGIYFFEKIYIKPWSRIQPYIVGIFLAYLLTYQSACKNKFKFRWVTNICLWTISIGLMLVVLFGLHGSLSTRIIPPNVLIIYQCFSRFTWSLGLAGAIFLCYTSNGYFINSILSWKIWRPLAKLNYSAFLVHPTVIFIYTYNMKRFFYLTDVNMVWMFCSTVVFTFLLGYLVSLLFEIPFIRMERFFFKHKRRD